MNAREFAPFRGWQEGTKHLEMRLLVLHRQRTQLIAKLVSANHSTVRFSQTKYNWCAILFVITTYRLRQKSGKSTN